MTSCFGKSSLISYFGFHYLYMKDPGKYLSALVLTFISGCAYEIEELYYKEIPPPEHQITFKLNKYDDADTIFLSGAETFTYEVGITPGKIEQVQMLLDDQVLLTSQGGKINYPFQGNLLKDGIYQLTIRFVASPGTGSLAESTGNEKLNASRTWMLKIDV